MGKGCFYNTVTPTAADSSSQQGRGVKRLQDALLISPARFYSGISVSLLSPVL